MKTRNPCSLFLALAVAGCATPSLSLNKKLGSISLGMSKQQVVQILGAPTESATGRLYDEKYN